MRLIGEVVKYGDLKPGDLFEVRLQRTPPGEPYEASIIGEEVCIRLDNEYPEWLKGRDVIRCTIEH